ncbi:MAG: sigma factor [Clostridiales bacterium]
MLELDARAAGIADNPDDREALIRQYKPFILKCASTCTNRYITDADDEWSIALQAFSEALDNYRTTEGHFLSFAKLVIRRRLYDYFDANHKYSHEISVAPALFSGETEDEDAVTEIYLQIKENLICTAETAITNEIEAADDMFINYGFSFFDLTACSPKAEKTKAACTKAIVYLLKNPILLSEMRQTRQLPIKIIAGNTLIPRKILERHRKYIIAVVELFSGEYPGLTAYLHPIREELNK